MHDNPIIQRGWMAVGQQRNGSCVARASKGTKVQRGGLVRGGTGTKVVSSVKELCSLTCGMDFFVRREKCPKWDWDFSVIAMRLSDAYSVINMHE